MPIIILINKSFFITHDRSTPDNKSVRRLRVRRSSYQASHSFDRTNSRHTSPIKHRSLSPSYNDAGYTFSNLSVVALIPEEDNHKYYTSDESSPDSEDSDSSFQPFEKKGRSDLKFDIMAEIGPELKNFLVGREDIRLEKKIGEGVYGSVWKGLYHRTDVAIKIFLHSRLRSGVRRKFLEEAEIMCSLRSPFIVLFMGVCIKFPQYFILTEFMDDGSLYDILHKEENTAKRKMVLGNSGIKFKIIESIAHGMNYLHEKKVLHCDLKSSNIVVG